MYKGAGGGERSRGSLQDERLQSKVQQLITMLAVSYLRQKGSIVGPSWKAPFIGPFLQSMNPKFSEYYGKWQSGELSCVSIFHK